MKEIKAQFWEKKKKKKGSGFFLWVSAVILGVLFLAPQGWWGSLWFSHGFNYHGSFDEHGRYRLGVKPVSISAQGSSFRLAGSLENLRGVSWDQKLGRPTSVLGLVNPADASERPDSVYVSKDPFPQNSDLSSDEGDLLTWALSRDPQVGKVSSSMVRRGPRVSRRTQTSDFAQTFNSRSKGCLDGPSCAMMQLARAKAESSFLCKNNGCSSSVEYDSAQLSSIFDGSDGTYRSIVLLRGTGSSSAPEIHKLGVPLF